MSDFYLTLRASLLICFCGIWDISLAQGLLTPFGSSGTFTMAHAMLDHAGAKTEASRTDLLADYRSESQGWYHQNWENRLFNPYKGENSPFPVFIEFSDSVAHAPMQGRMVVTSRYGWRNGQLHQGIDLDLVTGDEVYAMAAGKVRYVKYHAGHGNTVIIRHANGVETVYAHLSRQLVKEDDWVECGELIGKGGTTGNARGSHLHLEVRYRGFPVNPEYFFDFNPAFQLRAHFFWVSPEYADARNYISTKQSGLRILTSFPGIPQPSHDEDVAVEVTNRSRSYHVVQFGDTIYSLARKHQVKIEELCRVNGISDSSKIKVGQVLQFP